MSIVDRRLQIKGPEKTVTYLVESDGSKYRVTARPAEESDIIFLCSCGICMESEPPEELRFAQSLTEPCRHIEEAQRDLSMQLPLAA